MCKMAKSLTGNELNLHIFKNEKIFSKQDKPIDTTYQSAKKQTRKNSLNCLKIMRILLYLTREKFRKFHTQRIIVKIQLSHCLPLSISRENANTVLCLNASMERDVLVDSNTCRYYYCSVVSVFC